MTSSTSWQVAREDRQNNVSNLNMVHRQTTKVQPPSKAALRGSNFHVQTNCRMEFFRREVEELEERIRTDRRRLLEGKEQSVCWRKTWPRRTQREDIRLYAWNSGRYAVLTKPDERLRNTLFNNSSGCPVISHLRSLLVYPYIHRILCQHVNLQPPTLQQSSHTACSAKDKTDLEYHKFEVTSTVSSLNLFSPSSPPSQSPSLTRLLELLETPSSTFCSYQTASPKDYRIIRQQLGRHPKGLLGVGRYSSRGEPQVLVVSPLQKGEPFPTMFWLSDSRLSKAISSVEAGGFIKRLEALLQSDMLGLLHLALDQFRYIALRWQLLKKEGLVDQLLIQKEDWSNEERVKFAMEEDPTVECLRNRGIGGIMELSRVRCLHMHYAFHLMHPPTMLGTMMDSIFHLHKLT
eukprot:GHVS01063126.1.p1 GENE.GHVS01063126.1~~GHVS01063126.1.p1  ORF type:complete len:405 (-),score=64.88 GHVS01063126.1:30-1244(-)